MVLPVLSQSRCFISLREGGGFDLEAKPSTGQWKNQYINDEKANAILDARVGKLDSTHVTRAPSINGQNDVNVDNIKIMLISGCIFNEYVS